VLSLGISAARAQQASPDQLPPIEVSPPVDQTRTRAKPISDAGQARAAWRQTWRKRTARAARQRIAQRFFPKHVTTNRQFAGIVGASTTVITSEDIARSPAQTVQEIIAQTPGVQLTSLYGGVNGVGTTVDLRGFGAFATANTLVLINGRRLNDIDMAGVDLSTIPRDSIERIEITRGNSGAVALWRQRGRRRHQYRDQGRRRRPPVAMRVEAGVGSFNQRLASVSTALNSGPWSASFYGTGIKSDGYRVNNALDQRNGIGDIRYSTRISALF